MDVSHIDDIDSIENIGTLKIFAFLHLEPETISMKK
jgi:hypothetical protein